MGPPEKVDDRADAIVCITLFPSRDRIDPIRSYPCDVPRQSRPNDRRDFAISDGPRFERLDTDIMGRYGLSRCLDGDDADIRQAQRSVWPAPNLVRGNRPVPRGLRTMRIVPEHAAIDRRARSAGCR